MLKEVQWLRFQNVIYWNTIFSFCYFFFVQGKPRHLSSVSSVENDKHLIIFKIHGFNLRMQLKYSGSSFGSSTPCTYIYWEWGKARHRCSSLPSALGAVSCVKPSSADLTWRYARPDRWDTLGKVTTLGNARNLRSVTRLTGKFIPWECAEKSLQSLASTCQRWHMSPRPLRGSDLPPIFIKSPC